MQKSEAENPKILLNLLESIRRDGGSSQRSRASEFGVALGLVNSYLKFCVRKGYIKVKRIPAQRYMYFLTPKGFSEKSRLTVLLLANSLAFFRQARAECSQILNDARTMGWQSVVLVGASELAEITTLCALETGITITAVMDPGFSEPRFVDLPVAASFKQVGAFDGAIITDRFTPQDSFDKTVAALGHGRRTCPCAAGRHFEPDGGIMKMGHKWYVIHTHSHAELAAAAHLERQGFETYCPRYLRRRSHARRITLVPTPFFPRYIFVAVDKATQRWRAIRSTLGVSYMVGSEMGPTPVADWVVEDLRRREDAAGFIEVDAKPRFQRGEPVALHGGLFSGSAGIFDGLTDSTRIAVLIELLGRKVRVIFDEAMVGAA